MNTDQSALQDSRSAPKDKYCDPRRDKTTSSLAWAAQWALEWMESNHPENIGIVTALTCALDNYDKFYPCK